MALTIEKTIDLTASGRNTEPKYVSQLSIIHESENGELVQYYIDPETGMQGDKNTYAIGVYNDGTRQYDYTDYHLAVWNSPKQRIFNSRIDRLGVKAFPSLGAFAFYKLTHRKITRIVIPVNRKTEDNTPPTIRAVEHADGTTTFIIIPPDDPIYECYRIVMESGIYTEEWITYDLEFTTPKVKISGEYQCYAIGYGEEGQLYSKESNVIVLNLIGEQSQYVRPYYTESEINDILSRIDELERQVSAHKVEKDVPADAIFTDTIYDDTILKGQIRANLNNIKLLMDAVFNTDTHWLVDSDGVQLVDSNGYPLYTAEYTSKLDDIITAIQELQGRKYLYWGEPESEGE